MFQNPGSIVVEARQRELRHEAEQNRLARHSRASRVVSGPSQRPVLRAFALRLGRLVAAR
jgi:hypothetical protein